ncbi:MAG: phosphoribosylanthranilate isomerase [Flavobacteriaceae bacterium]|nr:phosphoribosylanthranilate isomerase [Flavobacteriaceae bacterium]|tara:strand:- start:449 stop:1066 length:618 start_codon:yes stop_codon:yes gene_type:complete
MKFKICGLFNHKNIYNVAQLNPDYIGHIFWEKSVRYVKGDTPNIQNCKKTGVFYNSNYNFICEKIKNHNLKCIQLHGDESPELCKKISENEVEIIKSFRVDQSFDFDILNKYMDCCDLFLFDSKSELPGGTGKSFDWEILKKYKLDKEFFISGGIGLDSINSIKGLVQMKLPLFGIDVNSKFEDESNLKVIEDLIKFKEIIDNEI